MKSTEGTEKPKKTSKKRKVIRTFVFLLFLAGFLYQVIQFLDYLFDYPTILNIEILARDEYISPAFTFCHNERIKRSSYCDKYPDRCEMPDDQLCDKHPHYCSIPATVVPKQEYLRTPYDPDDIIEMSHNFSEVMVKVKTSLRGNGQIVKVLRTRLFGWNEFSSCFVINYRSTTDLPPPMIQRSKTFIKFPYYRFTLDLQRSDSFDPETDPGIYFAIHSPFEDVNPFEKGLLMKPEVMYKITVSLKEEHLLPPPYKTMCMNYTEMWEKNNRTGPRSQEVCRQKCIADKITECSNCSMVKITYENGLKPCNDDQFREGWERCNKNLEAFHQVQKCYDGCKEECFYIDYTFEAQERYVDKTRKNGTYTAKDSDLIFVDIDIDDTEILSYSYRPQYQKVEAFSYIGGFIGIWLGVSLVQITDFLETILCFLHKCIKKKTRNHQQNKTN